MFKKILKWAGIIIVLAIVGFVVWRKNRAEPFVPRDFDEVVAELGGDPERIEAYTKQLVEAYKNDAYGGDTPEETLNLFIAALKAGDTDLAAKYFLLEEQEKMRGELQVGKEKDNLGFVIDLLVRAQNRGTIKDGRAILTVAENGKALMSIDLVQNPYTRKWKIESL